MLSRILGSCWVERSTNRTMSRPSGEPVTITCLISPRRLFTLYGSSRTRAMNWASASRATEMGSG